jgi:DNA mismatch repair protein MSH6
MDVSLRVCPEALVGRQLRIYWHLDDAWFAGSVESWDPCNGQHKVVYEDGSCEELWMGLQRVRLLVSAGEQLTPPAAATLQQLADK